jgi:hypothetical protein
MKTSTIWENHNFWFKLSLVAITVWLAFCICFGLILYFSWIYEHEELYVKLIEFSTWLFALPAGLMFLLFNIIPILVPWLLREPSDPTTREYFNQTESFDAQTDATSTPSAPVKEGFGSYKSMSEKLEKKSE